MCSTKHFNRLIQNYIFKCKNWLSIAFAKWVHKLKLVKELKDAVAESDEVFLATDPDREGEAISWHLAEILGLDLEKAIENSEEIKAILKDVKTSDYVNGNCVLLTVNPDAVKIFNGETLEG